MSYVVKHWKTGDVLAEGKGLLRLANLSDANLRAANLIGANLIGADLHDANLSAANLHGANLHGANLRGANLRYADLHGANLHGANLRYADLHGANGLASTAGTSKRGYVHMASLCPVHKVIIYHAGCRKFASADAYRAYYMAEEYAENHPDTVGSTRALIEPNISAAANLFSASSFSNLAKLEVGAV